MILPFVAGTQPNRMTLGLRASAAAHTCQHISLQMHHHQAMQVVFPVNAQRQQTTCINKPPSCGAADDCDMPGPFCSSALCCAVSFILG